jgi:hypothetical protein
MSFLKASRASNLPRSALENYVTIKRKDTDKLSTGRKSVLGDDTANQLEEKHRTKHTLTGDKGLASHPSLPSNGYQGLFPWG